MAKSNKNAATEDDIGKLHHMITKIHGIKAKAMLDVADRLLTEGHDIEEIMLALNTRDLSAAQKWVEYNEVSCNIAETEEGSELSKRLKELKDKQSPKIIKFEDKIAN